MSFYYYLFANALFFIVPPVFIYWTFFNKRYLSWFTTVIIGTLLGYVLGNLSIWLKWNYRIDYVNSLTNPTPEQQMWAVADGANKLFWLYCGWIPGLIYTVLCLFMLYLAIKLINIIVVKKDV